MKLFMFIFEVFIGVGSVISLLYIGIYIGKTYGSLEKFILDILDRVLEKLHGQ